MYNLALQNTAKNYGINKDKLLTEPWLARELTNSAAARVFQPVELLSQGSKTPMAADPRFSSHAGRKMLTQPPSGKALS